MNKYDKSFRSDLLVSQKKVTKKEKEFGYEEMDGNTQTLAWSFVDSFGVLATNVRFKEMMPKKGKRQLSSMPPVDLVTCKAIEQLLHKLD